MGIANKVILLTTKILMTLWYSTTIHVFLQYKNIKLLRHDKIDCKGGCRNASIQFIFLTSFVNISLFATLMVIVPKNYCKKVRIVRKIMAIDNILIAFLAIFAYWNVIKIRWSGQLNRCGPYVGNKMTTLFYFSTFNIPFQMHFGYV